MPKKSARAEMIELDGKHAVLQASEEQKQTFAVGIENSEIQIEGVRLWRRTG
jgi:hypothetical protein